MGLTIAQKILSMHSDVDDVKPGQLIQVDIDLLVGNNNNLPDIINGISEKNTLFDNKKMVIVQDNITASLDINNAKKSSLIRQFAKKYEIEKYYEVGRTFSDHMFVIEQGFVSAGDIILGNGEGISLYGAISSLSIQASKADYISAITSGKLCIKVPETVKININGKLPKNITGKDIGLYILKTIGIDTLQNTCIEIMGKGVSVLSIDDRLSICDMLMQTGAVNCIFEPDLITEKFYKSMKKEPSYLFIADNDAKYIKEYEVSLSDIKQLIAIPHLPDNIEILQETVKDINIDQVIIGGQANGSMTDMRVVSNIFSGRKIAPYVRCFILPATRDILKQCLKEGLIDIFIEAGAVISMSGFDPSKSKLLYKVYEGEKILTTTNKNYVGEMGHTRSEIYIASSSIAAATAVTGKITTPQQI